MHRACRLCAAMVPPTNAGTENTLLYDSDNFVVMPTLGQFIEGWVLVVSKKHIRCAREHSRAELDELAQVITVADSIVEAHYGPTIVFEHGPSLDPAQHAGCCVEHTHIHIAPCRDREAFLSKIAFTRIAQCALNELPYAVPYPSTGYLLAGSIGEKCGLNIFAIDFPAPRQYLRQVLAVVTQKEALWDWRQNPCMESIERTIMKFSRAYYIAQFAKNIYEVTQ